MLILMSSETAMLLLLLACAPSDPCAGSPDTDGDGLSDCMEAEFGSDPDALDSDGDGFDDGEEADCQSDPLNADQTCYACGWKRADSSGLSSQGAELGDTVADMTLHDQCGDQVQLYDFAGQWNIAFVTAAWCSACLGEAEGLDQKTQSLMDESGVPFSYMIVLFSGITGDPAKPQDAIDYAEVVGDPEIPVFADPAQDILANTPYDGKALPGKCLLSPSMEIVSCWTGHDNDEEAWEIVRTQGAQ